MIRERQVKGPISTVTHNGKEYRIEYRRRYYETATHFTWIEIEIAPHHWTECGDAWQTGHGGTKLTAKCVRTMVRAHLSQLFAAMQKNIDQLFKAQVV